MALTKVKLIADGVITSANLDASHGITTSDIGEGSNLYYTDSRVSSYLSTNGFATQTDIVAAITDSAPVTLDTLNELAAALGDDPNFATTTATSLGLKAPLASPSFTGNVAIGGTTITDSNLLNLQGSSASVNIGVVFNDTNTSKIFGIQNGSSALKVFDYSASAERMRIDSSGTIIGTGTYSAGSSIKIFEAQRSGGAVAGDWSYDDATTDMSLGTSTSHKFSLKTGNTRALTIDSSQNVGIGVSSLQPWARLQVAGTAGAQTGANQALYVTAPSTTAGEGVGIRLSAASGSNEAVGIIGMVNNASGNSGSMTFHTYNGGADIPERMRITSSGNVSIDRTTDSVGGAPSGTDGRLNVYTDEGSSAWAQQIRHDSTTGNGLFIRAGASSSYYTAYFAGYDESNVHFVVRGDGNVGIGEDNPSNNITVKASNTGTQIATIPVGKFINTGNSFSKLIIGSDNANFDGVFSMDNDSTLANTKLRIYIGNGTIATSGHSNDQIVLQGDGNVGIGTDSPQRALDIVATADSIPALRITRNGDSTQWMEIQAGGADTSFISRTASVHSQFKFVSDVGGSQTTRMIIDQSGNVGINASASLRFNGAGDNTHAVGYDSTVDGSFLRGQNGMRFITGTGGGSERMRITSGGEVGIGTDFVSAKVQIHSTNAGQATIPLFIVNESTTLGTEARLGFAANTNNDVGSNRYSYISTINTSGSNGQDMIFATNATGASAVERMRITSGGDLFLGKTVSSVATAGVLFEKSSNGLYSSITNSQLTYLVYDVTNPQYRFYVSGGGQIHATSTSITAISDITLKQNIKPLETGLNEVMKLQPRRFDWKNGDGENIAGFIAQEVEEVLPDLVSESKYNDEETKKSLRTGDMIPTLVKAIQELKADNDNLRERIQTLENQ